MITPMTPPNRMLPAMLPFVADSTVAIPGASSSFLHVTIRSSFDLTIVVEPGVVTNHLPLSLSSSHMAPETCSVAARVSTEMVWSEEPMIEAQAVLSVAIARMVVRVKTVL